MTNEARWNYNIDEAPKDGRMLLFLVNYGSSKPYIKVGSWTTDDNMNEEGWFDDSYDDFSTGYSSNPLDPVAWFDPELILK